MRRSPTSVGIPITTLTKHLREVAIAPGLSFFDSQLNPHSPSSRPILPESPEGQLLTGITELLTFSHFLVEYSSAAR
jgi:hypothetical protein